MVCDSIKPNINKICAANLDKKIKLQYSSSAPNNGPNTNASTAFKTLKIVWAMLKTKSTAQFINNTNIQSVITSEFYIRYDSGIDFKRKLWIEFRNSRYEVINYENIDEKNRFVKLTSVERGLKTINANQR